ncbi:MAG: hypothetical protein KDM63_11520, partial [Verrucomicrobiae bacterium]|nr:hypothetical protein [Verrucomicrobiae bacterium]
YLKASNTDNLDQFGKSVAVSGDTVVVGAFTEDSALTGVNSDPTNNTGFNTGAAYVFVRDQMGWVQQAYLKASNTEDSDHFGWSVGISGDTVVVGAIDEDGSSAGVNGNQSNNGVPNSGAAYVFVRTGTQWSQQAYLKASNPGTNDNFGYSVSISGNTILVGAPFENSGSDGVNGIQADESAGDSGAAYVFARSGTRWSQQAYLKASNSDASDQFGKDVAISENTVVVGAIAEDSPASGVNGDQTLNTLPGSGAAYVFIRGGTRWSQQAYLKSSAPDGSDNFGEGVAVSGDTVVVGAPYEDSNATGVNGDDTNDSVPASGAAYVFVWNGTTWTQQAYVKASNTGNGDQFAESVALSGDSLLVGAKFEDSTASGVGGDESDNTGTGVGAAYLFQRHGSQWSQRAYLKASNPDDDDHFGEALAISGNVTTICSMGEQSAATGVNGNETDDSISLAGAGYVFDIGPDFTSLSKTGVTAPGLAEAVHGLPGVMAIGPAGEAIFEEALSGSGAPKGRNRAAFSTFGPSLPVDALLQAGDDLSGLGSGYVLGNKVTGFRYPVMNRPAFGSLFQVTVGGPGMNRSTNCALMRDTGTYVTLLRRTGQSEVALGGAVYQTFLDVTEAGVSDFVALGYQLKPGTAPLVNSSNDTGIVSLTHAGAVQTVLAREGSAAFGGSGGTFGQFSGKGSMVTLGSMVFVSKLIPPAGTPGDAWFAMNATGGFTNQIAGFGQGLSAPGVVGGETFRALLGTSGGFGGGAGIRATLAGGATSQNEGIWSEVPLLMVQKGVAMAGLGDLRVTKILRFWQVTSTSSIILAQIGGTGVTKANNQVLVLRQNDGNFMTLMRTGDRAPGMALAGVTISKINAVDFEAQGGNYAILGTLKGAPKTANQAIWRGNVKLGDDTTLTHLRLPELAIQKGDRYTTANSLWEVVRGLSLRPMIDPSGAGRRGTGQVIGADGSVLIVVTGDRKAQEVVEVGP